MESHRPATGRRVVVTGIGAVSPNGVGRERFWQSVRDGVSGVAPIEGIDTSDLPVRIAGQVLDFDSDAVVDKRDRRHVPRVAALALAAADEALEDAGLRHNSTLEQRRRTGVVIGTGGAALAFAEAQFRQYYVEDPRAVSLYAIPSATPGGISSELSMRYDLRGPSHVLSTGCTSSTDAIGHALSLIRYGRCDRVLVGGSDAPLAHGILTGFCLMKVMTTSWNHAPERASRPFSEDRDGFVLAEGSWMLMLEALPEARRRDATIYGEIRGYGSTCEAFHRVRLNESGEEPARAIGLALEDAGLEPGDIGYMNLHGTSTQLNDRIEAHAVHRAFGERAARIPCSSTKSTIGHPQGACGAMGLSATLLAMRDGWLPPTINVDKLSPDCDLDVIPNCGRALTPDHALCNCIGFGSKNSALIVSRLEEG